MKRGEINLNIFIGVAVLAGLLFLLSTAVTYFMDISKAREYSDFIGVLNLKASELAGKDGVSETIEVTLPKGCDRVYLLDNKKRLDKLPFGDEPFIQDGLEDHTEDNVYVMEKLKLVSTQRLDNLNLLSPHYICINQSDRPVRLQMVGTGRGVDIRVDDQSADCTRELLVREVASELPGDFTEELDRLTAYLINVEKLKVEKTARYDPFKDRTVVKIRIYLEPPSAHVSNIEYYDYIPKCLIAHAADLNSIPPYLEPPLDEDPLVMWDFGSVGGEIEYTKEKVKISEACKEMLSGFAKGDGSKLSSGIIGGAISPLEDTDGDSVFNLEEVFPDDSDDDGYPDMWELRYGFDEDDSAVPGMQVNPDGSPIIHAQTSIDLSIDRDGDGLSDYREYKFGSDPREEDSDSDGVKDIVEFFMMTDPSCPDSERNAGMSEINEDWWESPCTGDGMPDWWEIENNGNAADTPDSLYGEVETIAFPGQGQMNAMGLNPSMDDAELDWDQDGLTNIQEFLLIERFGKSTNPLDPDTDDDGISDGPSVPPTLAGGRIVPGTSNGNIVPGPDEFPLDEEEWQDGDGDGHGDLNGPDECKELNPLLEGLNPGQRRQVCEEHGCHLCSQGCVKDDRKCLPCFETDDGDDPDEMGICISYKHGLPVDMKFDICSFLGVQMEAVCEMTNSQHGSCTYKETECACFLGSCI